MSRKRGIKRKSPDSDPDAPLAPPDRDAWPGWVEMESEPAFFNVMLNEMGARGVKVQEIWGLEDDDLVTLPQPVHALIFLFRYNTQLDETNQDMGTEQDHIWFANQVPSFACATVALLNIVNNIPNLEMRNELRDFKNFTKQLTPLQKGDAIDGFDHVRRIHNSFARENDMLQADVHLRGKFEQAKKRAAVEKARATKAANRAAKETGPDDKSSKNAEGMGRASARTMRSAVSSTRASSPSSKPALSVASSSDFGSADHDFESKGNQKKTGEAPKPNGNVEPSTMPRRSGRAPKPRQREVYTSEAEEPEEGFHFIAYMPVAGHVWKLDGLNYHPQDLGCFEPGGNGPDGGTGNWMHVAVPSIRGRMAQVEGTDISYNLMAVVHDLDHDDRVALLKNIKLIQVLDAKLDTMGEDWRELELGNTKRGVVCGPSPALDIIQYDIDGVDVSNGEEDMIASEDDLIKLLEHRQRLIAKQDRLRIAVVDAKTSERGDQEKARHRRHDYTSFVRGWIGALAEAGVLKDIVE